MSLGERRQQQQDEDDFEFEEMQSLTQSSKQKQQTSICFRYAENSDFKLAIALSSSLGNRLSKKSKEKREFTNATGILTGEEWMKVIEERASNVFMKSFQPETIKSLCSIGSCKYWHFASGHLKAPALNWKENFATSLLKLEDS